MGVRGWDKFGARRANCGCMGVPADALPPPPSRTGKNVGRRWMTQDSSIEDFMEGGGRGPSCDRWHGQRGGSMGWEPGPVGPERPPPPLLWADLRCQMCACHRRARKVSWLFSEHLPPRACGLLTQRDATGRPWRQPRMGVRRRPRAARPEWASGFEVCPHLLRALFAVVPCWRKAQCVVGRQSLPCHDTVEETELGIVEDQDGVGDLPRPLRWKGDSPAPAAGTLGADSPAFETQMPWHFRPGLS